MRTAAVLVVVAACNGGSHGYGDLPVASDGLADPSKPFGDVRTDASGKLWASWGGLVRYDAARRSWHDVDLAGNHVAALASGANGELLLATARTTKDDGGVFHLDPDADTLGALITPHVDLAALGAMTAPMSLSASNVLYTAATPDGSATPSLVRVPGKAAAFDLAGTYVAITEIAALDGGAVMVTAKVAGGMVIDRYDADGSPATRILTPSPTAVVPTGAIEWIDDTGYFLGTAPGGHDGVYAIATTGETTWLATDQIALDDPTGTKHPAIASIMVEPDRLFAITIESGTLRTFLWTRARADDPASPWTKVFEGPETSTPVPGPVKDHRYLSRSYLDMHDLWELTSG